MPSFANIVLADGAASPVNHTFEPVKIGSAGELAAYADKVGGIPAGYADLTISLRPPRNNGPVYKAMVGVKLPVLEAATGPDAQGFTPAPKVGYTLQFMGEFLLPTRSTLQNRKDIAAFAKNALAHATVLDVLHNLNNVY